MPATVARVTKTPRAELWNCQTQTRRGRKKNGMYRLTIHGMIRGLGVIKHFELLARKRLENYF